MIPDRRFPIALPSVYRVQDEIRAHVVYGPQPAWQMWPEFVAGEVAQGEVRTLNCKGYATLGAQRLAVITLARFQVRTELVYRAIRLLKADAVPGGADPDHVDAIFWDGRFWRRFASTMDTDWRSLERIEELPYARLVSWCDLTDIATFHPWPSGETNA